MKKSILFTLMSFCLLSVAVSSCNNSNKTEATQMEEKTLYQCPMDCEKGKTYDKPGLCPVCGMDLEKIEKTNSDDSTHQEH